MRHSLLAGIAVLGLAVPLLAETPASTPAPAAAKEALPPGVAKTLARPDLLLHYKEYGQGKPVLLLAGGPGSPGASIEPLARMVAKRGRALLPDPRGTGRSMPKEDTGITLGATLADFEALRAELGLKSWTVLGFSWGGMLALEYAAKHPGSLKALVLLDSGGTSGDTGRQEKGAQAVSPGPTAFFGVCWKPRRAIAARPSFCQRAGAPEGPATPGGS